MHAFRVFISYSHEDSALAQAAAEALTGMGLTPLWDKHIRPGAPFTEAIKGFIHHAHIFMPIITEHASRRPWVHQETGYAMALNIPIRPIAVDSVPCEMAAQLQAVVVRADFSNFAERLAGVDLEQVVSQPALSAFRDVEVTSYAEDRTEMLARCARRVMDLGAFGRVRQRAALSSFSSRAGSPAIPSGRNVKEASRAARSITTCSALSAGPSNSTRARPAAI
jgi:TIR domain